MTKILISPFLSSAKDVGRGILSVACLAIQTISRKPLARLFSHFTQTFLGRCRCAFRRSWPFTYFLLCVTSIKGGDVVGSALLFTFKCHLTLKMTFWVSLVTFCMAFTYIAFVDHENHGVAYINSILIIFWDIDKTKIFGGGWYGGSYLRWLITANFRSRETSYY